MTDPSLDAWRALACAVLVRACRDVHSTNRAKAAREAAIPEVIGLAGDARAFLRSDGAAWLVGLLDDVDPAGLDHALGELPPAGWVQLPLLLPDSR